MTIALTAPMTLAIPKGRIWDELAPVMKTIGIMPEKKFFDDGDRSLSFATNVAQLSIIRVRSSDVATFVAYGAAQLGVCGSDIMEESCYPDIYAPLDLGIGKCRLSVAEPSSMAESDDPTRWSHIRIATKYPNLTQRHFAARGVQAECIKLSGAMEIAPALNLCSHIVDLVSSGATLKANGLAETETILKVSSRLIVNRTALKTSPDTLGAFVERFSRAVR